MTTKIATALQFIATCVLAVLLGKTTGQAQAPQPIITLPKAMQQKFIKLPTPPSPKAANKIQKIPPMMSPYDRLMAPPLARWMKGKNIATPAKAKLMAKPAGAGIGEANAAVNGAVNFPGFVSAPFLTLHDGSTAEDLIGVSGDFNHDGKMDVAIIKQDGTIDVILNPGPGIANQTPIVSNVGNSSFPLGIVQVVVADMNGDGIPDLVGMDVNNSQVVVWISNGDGTFSAPHTCFSQLPKNRPWLSTNSFAAMAVGDFKGDGAMDVVVISDDVYDVVNPYTVVDVQTFLNDGSGNLAPLPAQESTLGDIFEGSFGQAVVTTNAAGAPTGIVFLMLDVGFNINYVTGVDALAIASNGDGTFSPVVAPALPLINDETIRSYGSMFATNLTAKGAGQPTTDIVFNTFDGAVWDTPFTSGNPTAANVLIGSNEWPGVENGTGNLAPTSFNGSVDVNATQLNVADMNGDGLQDLVVYQGAGIAIFPNAGAGIFSAAPAQLSGVFGSIAQPQPAAYDGSGYNSLVNVDYLLGEVGYFQNLGAAASVQAGQFRGATLPTGTDTTYNAELFGSNFSLLATGDINGDGIEDVIGYDQGAPTAVGYTTRGLVFGLSNGSGPANQTSNYTFTAAVNGADASGNPWYGGGNHPIYSVEPVTLSNPAGTLLVIAHGYANGGYNVFLIPVGKDGNSVQPQDLTFGPIPMNCSLNYADVGDVNGDGITDIVVAYPGCGGQDYPSGVFTFLGNPDGSFQTATFTPLGRALYKVKLINFTGVAGKLDIAASDYDNSNPMSPAFDLYVLPNKGDGSGTFDLTKVTIPLENYWIADIVAGDYNVDGHQDLTLLTFGEWNGAQENLTAGTVGVVLLPGNGDYTFGPAGLAASGIYAVSGKYADFNGDGLPDLAMTALAFDATPASVSSGPVVQVLPNQGNGTFGPPIAELSSYGIPLPTGYLTFVGKFSASGGPDLLMSSAFGAPALYVNRGVTTLGLTASSTTPGHGVPVTFTATLSQVMNAGVAPTGAVSFTSNGTPIGTVYPSNGVATLTADSLPVGSDSITATFAGDANHNQSSATLSITVAAVLPSFALSAPTASLSLTQGASGNVLVSVEANSTFTGIVQLTCSGAPAEVSCTPSPASVTLAAGQSASASIVIVTTPPNNTNQARSAPLDGTLGGISLAGLMFMLWPGRRRLPRLLSMLAIAALVLTSFGALSGCGGPGDKYPGTVAGKYTLTVTGVSGGITETQNIALTVTKPAQ